MNRFLSPDQADLGRVDAPIEAWAADNLARIRSSLSAHGLCTLHLSDVGDPRTSQTLIQLLGGSLMENVFWSTPRSRVADKTFTATEYPPREHIPLHSEMSYLATYPRLLCFHALVSAEEGGETTLADLDAVSADLACQSELVHERGLRYVRVFRRGIDIPIEVAFGTDDLEEIRRISDAQDMELTEIDADTIRIEYNGRGAVRDASTGDLVWFNQVSVLHPARIPLEQRRSMQLLFGEDLMPRQVCFADKGIIPDSFVHEVVAAFDLHTQLISWNPGDVVIVDNLRFAHGRRPYGGTRKLHVAMGMPQNSDTRDALF